MCLFKNFKIFKKKRGKNALPKTNLSPKKEPFEKEGFYLRNDRTPYKTHPKVQHWLVEEQFFGTSLSAKSQLLEIRLGCEPSRETDVYWECALKSLNCPNRLPPSADGCWRSSIQYW